MLEMNDENTAKRNEVIEIVARLTNGETYIDNHDNEEYHPEGIAVTDALYVCPVSDSKTFCLNPLYIEADGRIHLSMSSVGGSFIRGGIKRRYEVNEYNKECGHRLVAGKIMSVTWFYMNEDIQG